MCELSPVTFHGDTIFCIDYQNQPYTPAKPIVENMGLDWQSQAAKFRANKDRWGVVMIATPSEGGEQQTTCLPVRKLPAWLNSINPKKVSPELRPKIELYQAESDDALWNYWMNGRAERQTSSPSSELITPDQQCTLQAMVRALVERGGIYANIWSWFNNHFRIARYCQLPQSRMSEAIDYLMRFEITPRALPGSPLPGNQDKVPSGMKADRKEAMERIKHLSEQARIGFGIVRNIVAVNCSSCGISSCAPQAEHDVLDVLDGLQATASSSLAAAYNALESAYRLGRCYGRG